MAYKASKSQFCFSRCFLSILLLCLAFICHANENSRNINILINPESGLHKKFVQALQQQSKYKIEVVNYKEKVTLDKQLVIALGEKACAQTINGYKNLKILCTLIPSFKFSTIEKQNGHQVGAIFVDQPLDRRFEFIQDYFPTIKKIAVITSENSFISKSIEYNSKLTINHYQIKNSNEIIKKINTIKDHNDAILAIEDHYIYNPRTIKSILLHSYRNKLPIYGFSKSFTKAGAIASIFSSIEDLSQETLEIIAAYHEDNGIKLYPKYAKYYSTAFNKQVAQTLFINIPEDIESE